MTTPKRPGTLRLSTFLLPPCVTAFDANWLGALREFARSKGGEFHGYIFDRLNPRCVAVQIQEGTLPKDLARVHSVLLDGAEASREILEDLGPGAVISGGVSPRIESVDAPLRYEFLLSFKAA